jgi:hypothetical protein
MNAHREPTKFGKNKRRKDRHWLATIFYRNGERFVRTYTDQKKAIAFAVRARRRTIKKTLPTALLKTLSKTTKSEAAGADYFLIGSHRRA